MNVATWNVRTILDRNGRLDLRDALDLLQMNSPETTSTLLPLPRPGLQARESSAKEA